MVARPKAKSFPRSRQTTLCAFLERTPLFSSDSKHDEEMDTAINAPAPAGSSSAPDESVVPVPATSSSREAAVGDAPTSLRLNQARRASSGVSSRMKRASIAHMLPRRQHEIRLHDEVLRDLESKTSETFFDKSMSALGAPIELAHAKYDKDATACQRYEHVFAMNTDLSRLSDLVYTCPNCKEQSVNHARERLRGTQFCDKCDGKDCRKWSEANGLELDLGLKLPMHARSPAQVAWLQLQERFPVSDVSPLEEALMSPVLAMTTVLRLPSDGQLGYTSNVIHWENDISSVVSHLPRSPADAALVVYKQVGSDGSSKLLHVNKERLKSYIVFMSTHNEVYRAGTLEAYTPRSPTSS